MDSPGPMMLPKGILMNSSAVYDEVAGYSTLPSDKVHKYWHVYTTTNKKLKDPTARRLENFWWHVWGSDRSKLSGPVLARIFEDISLGPTVVPLRGPANRWEGPDVPPLTIEMIMAHLQGSALLDQGDAPPSTTKQNGKFTGTSSSSSAARPSPLPPILKKVGSSSANMARNTARFVSPHESGEEDTAESDIPSSGSTLANGFDMSGHAIENSPLNEMRTGGSPNLQSSAVPSKHASKSQMAEKKPMSFVASSRLDHRAGTKDSKSHQTNTETADANSRPENKRQTSSKLSAREKIALGKQPVRRSKSDTTPDGPRELPLHKSKRSLFTEATSSTTNAAAQGTIIDQAGSISSLPQISTSNLATDDDTSPHGGFSASSLLEARLTPTQPSSSAALPLGRTKSQLTLLLEREKGRSRS